MQILGRSSTRSLEKPTTIYLKKGKPCKQASRFGAHQRPSNFTSAYTQPAAIENVTVEVFNGDGENLAAALRFVV
jgi:hypothetical protein